MSAASSPPPGGPPDDPRDDIPNTHDLGGHCSAGDCYNARWIEPTTDLIVNGVIMDGRLRRYCRRCSLWIDAAIKAAGGGEVIRGPWQE